MSFASVRLGEYTYMLGGLDGSGRRADVWRTLDGSSWERVLQSAPWAARFAHAVVAFEGAMWLIGGKSSTALADVWRSTDGVEWQLVNEACPWAPRYSHGATAMDGKLWISGGQSRYDTIFGDVWSSEDGVSWQLVTGAAPWGPRYSHGMAAHRGELWVACGADMISESFKTVWHSVDGANWVMAPGSAGFRRSAPLRSYGGRLWISGGYFTYDDDMNPLYWRDLLSSEDGLAWQVVIDPAPWEARLGHGMEFTRGGLIVFGGGGFLTCTDVWRSKGTLGNHTADLDQGRSFELVELLRAIQLYNSGEFHCDPENDEDGFAIGAGDQSCTHHQSDYAPQDWRITLTELLRLIQFYNTPGGYRPCDSGEDGYCTVTS